MVTSRKGSDSIVWKVPLPGLKDPAIVRRFDEPTRVKWVVCPPWLTSEQRQAAVDLVKDCRAKPGKPDAR